MLARAVGVSGGVLVAQGIVADGVRSVHRLFQILVVDRQRRTRGMSPHAREAVGLQLDPHRGLVLRLATHAHLHRANDVLHVMPHFVR